MNNKNDFNKGKKMKKQCKLCRISHQTGRRVAKLMLVGASQAAINRAVENGEHEMELERQRRAAVKASHDSFRKDELTARADRL
jgi:hypothetical protein